MYDWHGWHMGGMWVWWLLGALIIALLAVLLVWAFRSGASPQRQRGRESAKEIAQERYARGEISRDQYSELIEDLQQ